VLPPGELASSQASSIRRPRRARARAATGCCAGAGGASGLARAAAERRPCGAQATRSAACRGETGDGLGFCCFYTMGERLEPLDRGWTVKNSWAIWAEMGLLCITFFFFFFDFIALL